MTTIRSDSISCPPLAASNVSRRNAVKAEPEVSPSVTDVVQISDAARLMQTIPDENTYDPHHLNIFGEIVDATTLPVQKLGPDDFVAFTDEASFKAYIKEHDYLSRGIYVDDKFVDAVYKFVMDPQSPCGLVAPSMDLPTPPSWWIGYRPVKA